MCCEDNIFKLGKQLIFFIIFILIITLIIIYINMQNVQNQPNILVAIARQRR